MGKVDEAVSRFKQGFICSQSILWTYGEQFGLDSETALKLASAFGGGMSRRGETCGAVSGALMVVGLKYGATKSGYSESKENTYNLSRRFIDEFKKRHSSVLCREILGYDISNPESNRLAKEKRVFTTLCPNFVNDAAEILESILG